MSHNRSTDALATVAGKVLRTRWVVRAPIGVYKARLGVLFGSRLCMIEHVGRKSGLRRYVVVEIVDRPTPASVIVASGFGARAQWYRNILANPSVRVWVGSHPPRPAHASPLPPEQAAAVLDRYAQRHPRSWAALQPVFETTLDAEISRDGTTLPLVRIDLDGTQRFRR